MRFYPHFEGLRLDNVFVHPAISRTLLVGIAVCLLTVTVTGIGMDLRRIAARSASVPVAASAADTEVIRSNDLLDEIHTVSGNMLMAFIAIHVTYVYTFKNALARFMLFAQGARPPK